MRKIVFFFFIIIGIKAFPQSACQSVTVGEQISITYAKSYLETLKKKTTNKYYEIDTSITDTFQIVDICIVDSVVIVELVLYASDTAFQTPHSFYILSKSDSVQTKGECLEVGNHYYLTIFPYYTHGYFVSIGSPGMPIILNDTAYLVWFVGNIYYSREIQGKYYMVKG